MKATKKGYLLTPKEWEGLTEITQHIYCFGAEYGDSRDRQRVEHLHRVIEQKFRFIDPTTHFEKDNY